MSQVLLALHLDRVFELARGRAATPVEDLQARLAANRAARDTRDRGPGRTWRDPTVPRVARTVRAGAVRNRRPDARGRHARRSADPGAAPGARPGEGALTVGTALRLLSSSVEAHLEARPALAPPPRALFARGLLPPRDRWPRRDLDRHAPHARRGARRAPSHVPPGVGRLGPLPARTYETVRSPRRALVGTGGEVRAHHRRLRRGQGPNRAGDRAGGPAAGDRGRPRQRRERPGAHRAGRRGRGADRDASLVDAALVLDDAGIAFGPGHPAAARSPPTRSRTGAIVVATVADQAPADRRLTDLAGRASSCAASAATPRSSRGAAPRAGSARRPGLSLIGEDLVLTRARIGQAAALVSGSR